MESVEDANTILAACCKCGVGGNYHYDLMSRDRRSYSKTFFSQHSIGVVLFLRVRIEDGADSTIWQVGSVETYLDTGGQCSVGDGYHYDLIACKQGHRRGQEIFWIGNKHNHVTRWFTNETFSNDNS